MVGLLMLLTWVIFIFFDFKFLQKAIDSISSRSSFSVFWILAGFLGIDVILPVPSTVIFTLAGNILGIYLGMLSITVGMLICSVAGYILGYYSEKSFLKKLISKKDRKKMQLWNLKSGHWLIIISKGLPIVNESLCLTCGLTKMSFKKYITFSFAGILPLAFAYSFFGSIAETIEQVLMVICFGFLISFMVAILIKKKWNNGKPDREPDKKMSCRNNSSFSNKI
ncbi:MAG: VTT domain-containing protein [Candidatus Humimicrobiaceae bacterium]